MQLLTTKWATIIHWANNMLKYTLCFKKSVVPNFFAITSLNVLTESSSACTSHKFTTLKNCWTFGTALNRVQLIAQLTSGEHIFAPAYGQRGTFWAITIMLIEWAVTEAAKQCSQFVDYFQIGYQFTQLS